MPLYEYECSGCGKVFEKLIRGESARATCPGCGSADVERKLSTFACGGSSSAGSCSSGG